MTVYISMHRPERATAGTCSVAGGALMGSVSIFCADGHEIDIYTTPEMARAIAEAVNAREDAKVDA